MQRRKFSREFKVEAVRLVRERGVSAAQAARELGADEATFDTALRKVGPIVLSRRQRQALRHC